MTSSPQPFVYHAILEKVVDGDTIDVTLDLGFDVRLYKQRCRLAGIDTPESRTRDLAEKKLGLAAKDRLKELCVGKIKIQSFGKGKYGRILAIPFTEDGKDMCKILIEEGHAVVYDGGKKTKVWGDY
jgi:micrococcal nuclease|tara:strand:+ start:1445 stop:1825 length:381 start_codon:yes stop_codon:yes gene_type:complete